MQLSVQSHSTSDSQTEAEEVSLSSKSIEEVSVHYWELALYTLESCTDAYGLVLETRLPLVMCRHCRCHVFNLVV